LTFSIELFRNVTGPSKKQQVSFLLTSTNFNPCLTIPQQQIEREFSRPLHSTPSQIIKFYQLLAHGGWFSPSTPASSTTKTGRHDIAEILLKVALSTKINQSINVFW
jgi:hypothetical protein